MLSALLIPPKNAELGNIIKSNKYDPVYNPISAPVSGTSRDFLPVSPTAGSLGVFGQIPVGNFTGTADINIPLYTIKYKDLSLPLSLNYHASGIKPELFPGPVGLGWTFIAGGTISRVIKGYPDWGDYPAEGNGEQPLVSQRAAIDWNNVNKLKLFLTQSTLAFANTNEPDEYYFNINGESGKFYVDHTDTFRIQSAQGRSYRIIMHYEGTKTYSFQKLPQHPNLWAFEVTGSRPVYPETLYPYSNKIVLRKFVSGFTMIDESGISYRFGGSEKSIEFSRPGLRTYTDFPESYITPTSWFLTSIESPLGYKIEFEYEQQTIITKCYFSDVVLYQYSSNSPITGAINAMSPDCVKGTLINGCYLTQIKFPNGKIVVDNSYANNQLTFDSYLSYSEIPQTDFLDFRQYPDVGLADTERIRTFTNVFLPHKVDAIHVYDKSNNEMRKISFTYFPDIELRHRLRLGQVSIEAPSSEKNDYTFYYHDSGLPSYRHSAFQTDAYGYWNGNYQFSDVKESNFIEYMRQHPNYLNQLKQPNPDCIQAQILKKIVYPTGGYTMFDYETHEYGCSYKGVYGGGVKPNENGNKIASGVRIKSIQNYDKDKTLLSEKRYHYVKDYVSGGKTSSGVLAYTPQFYELYENMRLVERNIVLPYFFRFSTNPIFPLSETRGNLVTYSEVAVEDVGNGVSVFKYKNYDNGYADHQLKGFVGNQLADPYRGNLINFQQNTEGISMSLERGQLTNQRVYDIDKNLKKEIKYTYNDDPNRFNEHVRYLAYTPLSINMTGHSFHTISAGVYYTYYPYLKEKTELDYWGGKTITKSTRYEYDAKYRLLKSLQIIDNGQTIRKKSYYYPHESMDVAIHNQMVSSRLLNYPIKEEFNAGGKCITTYHQYATGLARNHSDWILKKSTSSQFDNGPAIIDVSYQAYDALGNPNGISYRKEGDNSYLWSYNGEYPIAFIEGVSFSKVKEILGDSFIDELMKKSLPTESDIQNVRTRLSVTKAPITTYTYRPLIGVTSITQPNGTKLTYNYDALGRLLTVKDGDGKVIEEYEYHYQGN